MGEFKLLGLCGRGEKLESRCGIDYVIGVKFGRVCIV